MIRFGTASRYEVRVFKLATEERTRYREIEVIEPATHTTHSLSENEQFCEDLQDVSRLIKEGAKGPDRPTDIDNASDLEQDRTLEQTAELSCSIIGEMGV